MIKMINHKMIKMIKMNNQDEYPGWRHKGMSVIRGRKRRFWSDFTKTMSSLVTSSAWWSVHFEATAFVARVTYFAVLYVGFAPVVTQLGHSSGVL